MKNQKHDRVAVETQVEVLWLDEPVECSACHNQGGTFVRLTQTVPNCAGTKPIPVLANVHLDCIIGTVKMSTKRLVKAAVEGRPTFCIRLGNPPDYDSRVPLATEGKE
jgi:hypothetical protein